MIVRSLGGAWGVGADGWYLCSHTFLSGFLNLLIQ